ncbi:hypothetical protein GCM10022251_74270 [Phytohabitans flavus]|uniref:Uncharacterized protein n=1 Tax=Phytohabitans flavus TaxID=1076124 RepID=A0A6F8XL17_9ACTN|nr:hypothetical protein [Phytohabitans flavus]BCB74505.1 hypothetical protein Pflav_009150 [Phytohabitans flavus]
MNVATIIVILAGGATGDGRERGFIGGQAHLIGKATSPDLPHPIGISMSFNKS